LLQNPPKLEPKSLKIAKMALGGPKVAFWSQNEGQMEPKGTQNRSKIGPKLSPNGSKTAPNSHPKIQ